jgi:hypothetical protein
MEDLIYSLEKFSEAVSHDYLTQKKKLRCKKVNYTCSCTLSCMGFWIVPHNNKRKQTGELKIGNPRDSDYGLTQSKLPIVKTLLGSKKFLIPGDNLQSKAWKLLDRQGFKYKNTEMCKE